MKTIVYILIALSLILQLQAQEITDKEKSFVLSEMTLKIDRIYPFKEVTEKILDGMHSQIADGYYDGNYSYNEFANQVTINLENFSNDKHLDLLYDPSLASALLNDTVSNTTIYTDEEAKIEVWNNYGFKDLSILDGNIGYMNLTVFFTLDYAGKIADAAMNYFSNCRALIIDLRQNGGGWGDMVEYLLGYFIEEGGPILLNITTSTRDNSYYSSVIPGYVHGRKLAGIPIYILISSATASAAESFTINMKFFNKNVTLVGQKTRGAENPVEHIALNENFVLQIPAWKRIYSRNPVTWEGIGINPDVEVESEIAKKTARSLALKKLISMTDDEFTLEKFNWALDGLNADYKNLNKKLLDKIVGQYDKIKIFYKDEILYYKYEERSPKKLIPISENYFIVEGMDYMRIKFALGDKIPKIVRIYSYGIIRESTKEQ